jgi:hypothetical protein
MQSMRIVTLSPEGSVREFAYECHSADTALAIIQGTMSACENTGWSIKEMSVA